jgi:hypothetical protein
MLNYENFGLVLISSVALLVNGQLLFRNNKKKFEKVSSDRISNVLLYEKLKIFHYNYRSMQADIFLRTIANFWILFQSFHNEQFHIDKSFHVSGPFLLLLHLSTVLHLDILDRTYQSHKNGLDLNIENRETEHVTYVVSHDIFDWGLLITAVAVLLAIFIIHLYDPQSFMNHYPITSILLTEVLVLLKDMRSSSLYRSWAMYSIVLGDWLQWGIIFFGPRERLFAVFGHTLNNLFFDEFIPKLWE